MLINMTFPRVYLIDSSIYIFRAWPIYDTSITDRDGKPCNAVFGFSDFIYQLIQQKNRNILRALLMLARPTRIVRSSTPPTKLIANLHLQN